MQREINQCLKDIQAAKLRKNYHECIRLYHGVGGLYTDIGSYDEAFYYLEEAYKMCLTVGDASLTAKTFRFMGEAKAALGCFPPAIDYTKRYLELAEKSNDQIELQRAWFTLGRIYYMQAEYIREKSTTTDKQCKDSALEAEKKFQTALRLAESVRDQVTEKEYAQMTSAAMVNLGLIKDICGLHQEAVIKFTRAIEICKAARIKEDLYRPQNLLAGIYRQKNDVKNAVKYSEQALQTAKSIGKKILICDALLDRGLASLCQRDFKNAKRNFVAAYLTHSPNEEDHSKAIRMCKLSHLIIENYAIISKSDTSGECRVKSYDKLGDLFVAVCNYKLAVEFYRRAFSSAKVLHKPKSELARILFSIAETYADDGQFHHALLCYEKELSLREGNPKEQCQSLIKIAYMNQNLSRGEEKIIEAYEKALEKADKQPSLMYQVLRYYVPYMKQSSSNPTRCYELEETLSNLQSYPEIKQLDEEDQEDCPDLEDEVANIDDIISDDDDDDQVLMIARRKASKFKQNEVGDTPLHEACIKNDLKRVKSLIARGHDINPKDHAGWIPLHEACNHGHYDIAEYLVNHGADINNRGLKGVTPLHDAATNGHFDIMRLLIQNRANVIALTDTGETVLSCLRDYKQRNYSNFSNQDISEYKQMEAELLNTMDRSGFSLMTEGIKSSSTTNDVRLSGSMTNDSSQAHRKAPPTPSCSAPKLRNSAARFQIDTAQSSGSAVRDYRHTIQTLKRVRNPSEPTSAPVLKKSQPANSVDSLGSISTKQWLAADDFEEYEEDVHKDKKNVDVVELLDSEPEIIQHNNDCERVDRDYDETINDDIMSIPSVSEICPASANNESLKSSEACRAQFLDQPLHVTIEDLKLIVPIKSELATIRELKQSIVDRYSILTHVKPKIKLKTKTRPDCYLFDDDLCSNVIRDHDLIAEIESWNLDSIEETYVNECLKHKNLDPMSHIRLELRSLDEIIERATGQAKLNWSHIRLPHSHLQPILVALSRRAFRSADFRGSTQLFECQMIAQELLLKSCILTWQSLTLLSLKCTGLLRSQFELLCSGGSSNNNDGPGDSGKFSDSRYNIDGSRLFGPKAKLPELQSLDVSVNSIAYKSEKEFMEQLERLRQVVCPKLKRLDARGNHLQFVRKKSSLGSDRPPAAAARLASAADDGDSSDQQCGALAGEQANSSHSLADMELLLSDQYDYALYTVGAE